MTGDQRITLAWQAADAFNTASTRLIAGFLAFVCVTLDRNMILSGE
jgi:hypothetical protein